MTGSQFEILMPILERMEAKIDTLAARIDSLEKTRDEDEGAARERHAMRKRRTDRQTFLFAAAGGAAGVATVAWIALQILHAASHLLR